MQGKGRATVRWFRFFFYSKTKSCATQEEGPCAACVQLTFHVQVSTHKRSDGMGSVTSKKKLFALQREGRLAIDVSLACRGGDILGETLCEAR